MQTICGDVASIVFGKLNFSDMINLSEVCVWLRDAVRRYRGGLEKVGNGKYWLYERQNDTVSDILQKLREGFEVVNVRVCPGFGRILVAMEVATRFLMGEEFAMVVVENLHNTEMLSHELKKFYGGTGLVLDNVCKEMTVEMLRRSAGKVVVTGFEELPFEVYEGDTPRPCLLVFVGRGDSSIMCRSYNLGTIRGKKGMQVVRISYGEDLLEHVRGCTVLVKSVRVEVPSVEYDLVFDRAAQVSSCGGVSKYCVGMHNVVVLPWDEPCDCEIVRSSRRFVVEGGNFLMRYGKCGQIPDIVVESCDNLVVVLPKGYVSNTKEIIDYFTKRHSKYAHVRVTAIARDYQAAAQALLLEVDCSGFEIGCVNYEELFENIGFEKLRTLASYEKMQLLVWSPPSRV